jgi:hypothetical protein
MRRRRALAAVAALGAALAAPATAQARIASFTAVPNPGAVGVPVEFDGSSSIGISHQILCPSGIDWYHWDFNSDGVVDDEGVKVDHVFASAGTHNVTLTVGINDGTGYCESASVTKQQTIYGGPGLSAASVTRSTPLSGAEQSETSAGDPDGTGSATFRIYTATNWVCFEVSHANVEPTNAGHIHLGARGANGPPVVNLYSSLGSRWGYEDCVPADPVTVAGLVNNPRGYYVQLHNEPFPLGVVRGQLGD